MIAGKYHTIYITPFQNKIDITRESDNGFNYRTYRPLIETDVTNTVMRRYLIDGNLKPVEDKDAADLLLTGELVDFRKDPLRYDAGNNVQEYRVNVVVHIKLVDAAKGTTIWDEPSYTGYATYFVTGPSAGQESTTISNAIDDLSRRIVERTVEQW